MIPRLRTSYQSGDEQHDDALSESLDPLAFVGLITRADCQPVFHSFPELVAGFPIDGSAGDCTSAIVGSVR
jgi:hypothetical protein